MCLVIHDSVHVRPGQIAALWRSLEHRVILTCMFLHIKKSNGTSEWSRATICGLPFPRYKLVSRPPFSKPVCFLCVWILVLGLGVFSNFLKPPKKKATIVPATVGHLQNHGNPWGRTLQGALQCFCLAKHWKFTVAKRSIFSCWKAVTSVRREPRFNLTSEHDGVSAVRQKHPDLKRS